MFLYEAGKRREAHNGTFCKFFPKTMQIQVFCAIKCPKHFFFWYTIPLLFPPLTFSPCLITSLLTDYMVQENNGTSKIKSLVTMLQTCALVLWFRYAELGFPILFPHLIFFESMEKSTPHSSMVPARSNSVSHCFLLLYHLSIISHLKSSYNSFHLIFAIA